MPEPVARAAPTTDEVRAIATTSDPVLRNHRITLGYHRLAVALASRLEPGGCGNWCAFAVWASRQAGRTIRGEDLHRSAASLLKMSPDVLRAVARTVAAARLAGSRRTIGELQADLARIVDLDGMLERSAAAVARGNRLVFEEVGSAVAEYLEQSGEHGQMGNATDAPARAGDPPPNGTRFLRGAMQRYSQRAREGDVKLRAELLLLGNAEIAHHEQIRVQPEIQAAVHAAMPDPEVLRERVLRTLFPSGGAITRARSRFWIATGRRSPLDAALDDLMETVRKPVREAITEHLMTLEMPDGETLRLAADVRGAFPTTLQQLQQPDLVALLRRIDMTPDSLAGTGVPDWSDVDRRVHFIIDLFRVNQERESLLTPPYTTAQSQAILAARMPAHVT